jgi:hypothetical protein
VDHKGILGKFSLRLKERNMPLGKGMPFILQYKEFKKFKSDFIFIFIFILIE